MPTFDLLVKRVQQFFSLPTPYLARAFVQYIKSTKPGFVLGTFDNLRELLRTLGERRITLSVLVAEHRKATPGRELDSAIHLR